MAFRFRRTMKIAPGVRLNLTKKGVSVRVGPRGVGATVGTSGTTISAGVPGTGVHVSEKIKKRKSAAQPEVPKKNGLGWVLGVLAVILTVWMMI